MTAASLSSSAGIAPPRHSRQTRTASLRELTSRKWVRPTVVVAIEPVDHVDQLHSVIVT